MSLTNYNYFNDPLPFKSTCQHMPHIVLILLFVPKKKKKKKKVSVYLYC